MSSDWPEVKLEDVVSILGDGLHGTPNYDENGEYYFINGNNLGDGKITIDEKTKRASKEEYFKYKKNLNDRTILVSINGTIGNVGLYRGEKVFLGKSACYFNVLEDVDKQFIRYVVTDSNFQNYINSLATGSTIKNVSLRLMRDYAFRLPPLSVQKQISKVLEDLDAKIELNRRMNETLEAIARAIFKSWFVDFDPVRAKASGEAPESICRRLRLPPDLLALFPDRLVDSELGEIPEGWEVKPFGEFLAMTIGGDWGKDQEDEKHTVEVRIIRGTDMPKLKSGVSDQVPRRFVQESKFKSRKLQVEDMVIEVSGGSPDQPTGRALRVTQRIIESLNENVVPASFCRLFRPTDPNMGPILSLYLDFIYEAGKTWEYQNQSTGISNFQTTYFLERELVVAPSNAVRNAFFAKVEPLLSGQYLKECATLADIRDTLLPKLLSGDLRVPVVEVV